MALIPAAAVTSGAPSLPFACGERLTYALHAGPGLNGKGAMWIEGPVEVAGRSVMVLNSTFSGGFGPIKVLDRTTSWLDPERMASMRFVKEERNPLGRHSEDVTLDLQTQTWRAADGRTGATPSDQPLDELSFMYMLRTMRIPDDSTLVLNRHFDADRNPTRVRSLGRGSVNLPMGTFATHEIEMRVRDARRYRGEGVIRISLSDDACRRPLRIVSRIPHAGNVVMTLTAAEPSIAGCAPE